MQEHRQRRRLSRGFWVVAAIAFALVLGAVTPSPFVIERPGPVVDTLGEIELEGESEPVIELRGVETFPTSGELNLVSVTVVGSPDRPANWLSLVWPVLDPTQNVLPQSQVFPPGTTSEEREEVNMALMGSSQEVAAAAALHQLGEDVPTELVVGYVDEDGPASGTLRDGDRLLSVDGHSVGSVAEVRARVAESGAETPSTLLIERDGSQVVVEVLAEATEASDAPMLGIGLREEFELPFTLDMSIENIGGPSAGVVFALAMYDQLTRDDVTGGMSVSGTGTISSTGEIGEIGGLAQKIWGASRAGSELLVFPSENCSDVPERVPEDIALVPVSTLEEAIEVIQSASDGNELPGLSSCSDVG